MMPAGNTPSAELELYLVIAANNQLGAFGPRSEDISRMGLDALAYVETGDRGDLVQTQAIHFADSEQEARDFIDAAVENQAKEIVLRSTSTGKEWFVYLYRLAASYRAIVDTGRGAYLIRFNMEVQRTK